jgi:hypothetical protein
MSEHQQYHKKVTSVKVEDIRMCIENCGKMEGGR